MEPPGVHYVQPLDAKEWAQLTRADAIGDIGIIRPSVKIYAGARVAQAAAAILADAVILAETQVVASRDSHRELAQYNLISTCARGLAAADLTAEQERDLNAVLLALPVDESTAENIEMVLGANMQSHDLRSCQALVRVLPDSCSKGDLVRDAIWLRFVELAVWLQEEYTLTPEQVAASFPRGIVRLPVNQTTGEAAAQHVLISRGTVTGPRFRLVVDWVAAQRGLSRQAASPNPQSLGLSFARENVAEVINHDAFASPDYAEIIEALISLPAHAEHIRAQRDAARLQRAGAAGDVDLAKKLRGRFPGLLEGDSALPAVARELKNLMADAELWAQQPAAALRSLTYLLEFDSLLSFVSLVADYAANLPAVEAVLGLILINPGLLEEIFERLLRGPPEAQKEAAPALVALLCERSASAAPARRPGADAELGAVPAAHLLRPPPPGADRLALASLTGPARTERRLC